EGLVSLVGKVFERVQKFQEVHGRASPFYIVLLIYNVFDAGIFGGKLHARRYGCNRCNEISSTWMTCDSGKIFRPRFGSNGSA
ncbi:MAG: hypothetical protein PHU54_07820, partial [Candidatus Omnitrophica bacterium]|nr:hypothetical protein [Candidatus Omnitrophota bacterium]